MWVPTLAITIIKWWYLAKCNNVSSSNSSINNNRNHYNKLHSLQNVTQNLHQNTLDYNLWAPTAQWHISKPITKRHRDFFTMLFIFILKLINSFFLSATCKQPTPKETATSTPITYKVRKVTNKEHNVKPSLLELYQGTIQLHANKHPTLQLQSCKVPITI